MSGGISATAIAGLAAAAISAGTAVYSSNEQRKAQNRANDASKAAADAAKTAPGTQATKGPDQTLLNSAAGVGDNATSGSAANTLLTGAAGVDPNNLQLGKNTLGGSMLGANSLLGA
ncbi:hypothetical protein [Cupriavidus sp. 2SB]|uniref:hypothetical protein n=1 Tax=Cupriavidus sp. 2SB TaxID=2502199 RepID=UPI0010F730C1|nr:hypothetical protein [Cupriavidus sp. 2SB]